MAPNRDERRLQVGAEVAVRCHPGCPWMGGFEIVGVESHSPVPHYRVRRRGHQRPLPAALPADQVQSARAVSRIPA